MLKEARGQKKYSLADLEEITKIKSKFILAIENEKWGELPPFVSVLGFVKNLSTPLGLDDKTAMAVLKRDYPPKRLSINPKPDVSSKFSWSPKLTFGIGIAAVLILLFGYLGFQYYRFISPPKLTVDSPKENQVIVGATALVFGSTEADVKISVNNQPVIVSDDGKFSVNINVSPETKEIDVTATSRSGKMTEVKRDITVQ